MLADSLKNYLKYRNHKKTNQQNNYVVLLVESKNKVRVSF